MGGRSITALSEYEGAALLREWGIPVVDQILAGSEQEVLAAAKKLGYPVVLKQFIQFCLIIIYPAWVVGMLAAALFYGVVYGVLWVVFWPVRTWMKRNRPDEYAASQQK